jgi:hypothetical protein
VLYLLGLAVKVPPARPSTEAAVRPAEAMVTGIGLFTWVPMNVMSLKVTGLKSGSPCGLWGFRTRPAVLTWASTQPARIR